MTSKTTSGLDGVIVADTRLSAVDGEAGELIIAGHNVEALFGRARFEDVCALLWREAQDPGVTASRGARDGEVIRAALGAARVAAFELLPRLGGALSMADGMDALRAALAQVAVELPRSGDAPGADDAEERAALRLIGATAVFAAAWARRRAGQEPLCPDDRLTHAEDYLRMAVGRAPRAAAEGLDAYLVTVSDHGMNASTFTARVVASTGSDLASAVVAAVGALKGPLHGGAPGPVLAMLDEIGAPERALPWLESELAAGRRIMGMGHRIYRVRDPRAAVLERAIERLAQHKSEGDSATSTRLPLARAVEQAATGALRQRHPDRPLHANVEFYTAVLLDAVGLHRALFSPTFAVGRVAGWCAHVAEQRRTGRLIRPGSRYVGVMPAVARDLL